MDEKEASQNYEILGFVKELYRASYVNLCLAGSVRIPIGEYMGEEGEERYWELLKECLYRVEELSDMLESFDDCMGKKEVVK